MKPVLILTVLFLVLFIAYYIDKKNKLKKDNLKNTNYKLYTKLNCINGLNNPPNTLCKLYSYNDYYEFILSGNSYKLTKNKVTDVSIKSETEIKQQYVSSVGGAVAGSMLFGPLGAIIGGRSKKKNIKNTSIYLIFTYIKDNKVNYITFDANGKLYCTKFVNEFNKNKEKYSAINNIEL